MSLINFIDTKQIYLNSKETTKVKNLNYPLNSHIIYYFTDLIEYNDNVIYNSIKLSHAEIPYSFYIINEYNNQLIINDITLNLMYGNYNAINLKNELIKLFTDNSIDVNINFNTSNGKFSFYSNNTFTIKNSSLYEVIGLVKNYDYTSIINLEDNIYYINCDYPVNTSGLNNIYIKTNIITNNKKSDTLTSGIIKAIPVNVPPFGIIMYNNNENIESIIKNKELTFLELNITDVNNNNIDFNGLDWSITIEIKTYKKNYINNMNLNNENINIIKK